MTAVTIQGHRHTSLLAMMFSEILTIVNPLNNNNKKTVLTSQGTYNVSFTKNCRLTLSTEMFLLNLVNYTKHTDSLTPCEQNAGIRLLRQQGHIVTTVL
jgi:hypothetical protein